MAELTIDQALQQGVEAHKAGQVQDADRLYTAILKARPKHPDANHNMGVLAVGVGKVEQALSFFKTALEANPATAQFWLSYIDALIKLDQLTDAKAVLDQAKSMGAKGDGFDKLAQRLKEAHKEPVVASNVVSGPQSEQLNILNSLKLDQAIKLAKKKAKDGSPEEAKHIYQDILTKFPKNKRASDGLKGLTGKAVGKASKGQNPPQDQLQSLVNLYSQGELQQALKQAETLVMQFPHSAILFNIQGAVLKGLGQLDLSLEAYNKALAIKPDYAEACNNMGNALQEHGKLDEAIEAYNKALAIKPNYAEAYYNMGNALKEQGKLEEAIEAYNKALALKPDNAEAYNNMGNALKKQGKLDEAIEAYNKALASKPDYAEAYYNIGDALQEQASLDEAIEAYNKALASKPNYAEAYNNMGIALTEQGELEEAIEAYNKALAIKPDYAEAYNNMGNALKEHGKLDEAIEAYNKALASKPDYAEAYNNMGNALQEQGSLDEAIEAYNKALASKPNYAEAYNNMGNAFQEQGSLDEAIEAYNKALAIKPDYADAYNNMGNAIQEQGKLGEAIQAYNKALALKPDYADAYNNMGNALKEQGKLEEAIEAYNKALALKPDNAEAYNNMGNALKEQGKLDEAIEAYNKALATKPDYYDVCSSVYQLKAMMCNWNDFNHDLLDEYLSKNFVDRIKYPMNVFPFLHSILSSNNQLKLAKRFAANSFKNKVLPIFQKPKQKPKRLRIGYFSPDFNDHPVAQMIEGVFKHHDRSKFEIFAYSFSQNTESNMYQKIKNTVDIFRDVKSVNPKDIARLARTDRLDIAVDLAGYTKNCKTQIFNERAAPIQINYLGYPGTMGADFIDYIIADKILIPEAMESYYSEKLIFMPNSYQPTNDALVISEDIPSKNDLGLPENAFVFCAINQSYKIRPTEFYIWMRLLTVVQGSVLWLKSQNKFMISNLKKEAEQRGVDASRLIFAKRVPHEQYLAQFQQADLYLDTFNYNAGTTASDVLMAGLPIVTKTGGSYASSMAASLLSAADMKDLITNTPNEYEKLALDLATNPKKLWNVKERLRNNAKTTSIFDTKLYTLHLEQGYQQAYDNYYSDNMPQNIEVKICDRLNSTEANL